MRRHLLTLTVAGLLGSLLLASDASACCHKKVTCAEPCAAPCPPPPPPPPPPPAPPPCPPPKKCCHFGGHKLRLFGRCCHKRQPVCVMPVVYEAPAPVYYIVPSGQASPQY